MEDFGRPGGGRVTIAFVQRSSDGLAVVDQRGFTEPGGCSDEGQLEARALVQLLAHAGRVHNLRRRCRVAGCGRWRI